MHRDHPMSDWTSVVDGQTQLIDVREPWEFAEGALPGSRNIPLGDLPGRIGDLDPQRRVVLVCRSGGRSSAACELLVAAGFGDVVNLSGGMLARTEGATP